MGAPCTTGPSEIHFITLISASMTEPGLFMESLPLQTATVRSSTFTMSRVTATQSYPQELLPKSPAVIAVNHAPEAYRNFRSNLHADHASVSNPKPDLRRARQPRPQNQKLITAEIYRRSSHFADRDEVHSLGEDVSSLRAPVDDLTKNIEDLFRGLSHAGVAALSNNQTDA